MDMGEGHKVDPFGQRIGAVCGLRGAVCLIAIDGIMNHKGGAKVVGPLTGDAIAGVTSQIVSSIGNAKELKRIGAVISPVELIQQVANVAGIGQ